MDVTGNYRHQTVGEMISRSAETQLASVMEEILRARSISLVVSATVETHHLEILWDFLQLKNNANLVYSRKFKLSIPCTTDYTY